MSNALDLDKLDELHAKAVVRARSDQKDAAEIGFSLEMLYAYPALRAELRRLRAIEAGYAKAVEEAYKEGWRDGMFNGVCDIEKHWSLSDAKHALEPKP